MNRMTGEAAKSFGQLIAHRRKELGLTQEDLAAQLKGGAQGGRLSRVRVNDLEHDRYGVPRRPLLEQLAQALTLDLDVLYLWARRIPPDIDPAGVPAEAVTRAWRFFRAALEEGRQRTAMQT
jgi:transcriptional regulator with XRE-family HTH domain